MQMQKKFLQTGRICGILAVCGLLSGCGAETTEATRFLMDTACTIKGIQVDADAVFSVLEQLEQVLDCYDADSVTAQLNETGTAEHAVLADLIRQTDALTAEYGSLVDITCGRLTMLWGITTDTPHVPDAAELEAVLPTISMEHVQTDGNWITLTDGAQLDFGAVAKGYALDCIVPMLQEQGTEYAVISMVSSMLLYGEKPDGTLFSVAISDPEGGMLGTVQTEACFLSTSGGYERFFTAEDGATYLHILHPETGMPVETDLAGVTVFCDNGLESDFLSTAIYMGGTAELEPHLHAEDYQVVAVGTDGTVYQSDGVRFTPTTEETLFYRKSAASFAVDIPKASPKT